MSLVFVLACSFSLDFYCTRPLPIIPYVIFERGAVISLREPGVVLYLLVNVLLREIEILDRKTAL